MCLLLSIWDNELLFYCKYCTRRVRKITQYTKLLTLLIWGAVFDTCRCTLSMPKMIKIQKYQTSPGNFPRSLIPKIMHIASRLVRCIDKIANLHREDFQTGWEFSHHRLRLQEQQQVIIYPNRLSRYRYRDRSHRTFPHHDYTTRVRNSIIERKKKSLTKKKHNFLSRETMQEKISRLRIIDRAELLSSRCVLLGVVTYLLAGLVQAPLFGHL